MAYETIELEHHGALAILTLNRPEKIDGGQAHGGGEEGGLAHGAAARDRREARTMANIEYGREMFCLTAMAHSPEGREFRKIARLQGLKAAIRWREQRFK